MKTKMWAISVQILLAAAFPGLAYSASGPAIGWALQPGTSAHDDGTALAVDSSGNVYMAAESGGNLLSIPGGGTFDCYISKYSNTGAFVSTVSVTGLNGFIDSMISDSLGNVYMSAPTGSSELIQKVAGGGSAWTQAIGITSELGLAADTQGNVYAAGRATTAIGGPVIGSGDAILFKYNSTGTKQWSVQFGTASADNANAVSTDALGNVYVAGNTTGNFAGSNAGAGDGFLAKYDGAGSQVWKVQFGSAGSDVPYSVKNDAAGNIYVSGRTSGDFGGAVDGSNDAFLVKFDSAGNLLWKTHLGSSNVYPGDASQCLTIDAEGRIIMGGHIGFYSGFVAAFEADGTLEWETVLEAPSTLNTINGLAADAEGHVFATGATRGNFAAANAGGDDPILFEFTVPEPGTVGMLGLGVAGLLGWRKGKRQAAWIGGARS